MRRLILTALFVLAACRTSSVASLENVQIDVTPNQDQNNSGFCWAYASVAYLEQLHLASTGEVVQLSPDHLGLWNIIDQIVTGAVAHDGGYMATALIDIVPNHGIVPQNVFSVNLSAMDSKVSPRINEAVATYKKQKGLPANAKIPQSDALVIVQNTLGIPPLLDGDTPFQLDGKTYTPKSFATDVLKSKASDYRILELPADSSSPRFATAMQMIKRSLIHGHSVPIDLVIFPPSPHDGSDFHCGACNYDSTSGGHVVLVVDYQSATAPFGPLSLDQIKSAYAEPIQAFVFKNSWGAGVYFGNSTRPEILTRSRVPTLAVLQADYYQAGVDARYGLEVVLPAADGAEELDVGAAAIQVDWSQAKIEKPTEPPQVPVHYDPSVSEPLENDSIGLAAPSDLPPTTEAIYLQNGATYAQPVPGRDPRVCYTFQVKAPQVEIVALYRLDLSKYPYFIAQKSTKWTVCLREGVGSHHLVAQALDHSGHVLQSMPIDFSVTATTNSEVMSPAQTQAPAPSIAPASFGPDSDPGT